MLCKWKYNVVCNISQTIVLHYLDKLLGYTIAITTANLQAQDPTPSAPKQSNSRVHVKNLNSVGSRKAQIASEFHKLEPFFLCWIFISDGSSQISTSDKTWTAKH